MKASSIALIPLLILSSLSIVFAQEQLVAASQPRPIPVLMAQQQIGPPVPAVTLQLENAPVRDAIKALFDQLRDTGLGYAFEGNFDGTVTLSMRNVPYTDALATILRTTNLSARLENNVYVIGPSTPVAAVMAPMTRVKPPGVSISPVTSRPGSTAVVFDITLDGASAYEAIIQLMAMTKRNYVFDLGMTGPGMPAYAPRISAALKRVSFDQALDMIGKASGLAVERVGSSYVIKQVRPAPIIGAAPIPQSLKSTPAQFKCPRCSTPLALEWIFCPMCGAQVQAGRPIRVPGKLGPIPPGTAPPPPGKG